MINEEEKVDTKEVAKQIEKLASLKNKKDIDKGNKVFKKFNYGTKKKSDFKMTKILFWNLWNKYSEGKYLIDDRNKDIIYAVFRYFLQDEEFNELNIVKNEASLEKGLLIYGDYGIGKTFLFDILHKIGRELIVNFGYSGLWFNKISAGSFIDQYMSATKEDGTSFKVENYYKGVLYIDDLGFEKKAFNKTEIFGEILFERDKLNSKTYVTTNLTPSQIASRYDDRIADRLPKMFNIIKWNGESFRK